MVLNWEVIPLQEINKRVKHIREQLEYSQETFGNEIGLSKSGISSIESGGRNVTDKHIKLISVQFNVDENWLRTGNGNMFVEAKEISLDDYARKNGISEYETDIMKLYMSLDKNTRNQFMDGLRELSRKHEAKKNLSVVKDSTEDFGKPVAAHTTAPQTDEELRLMKKDLDELK